MICYQAALFVIAFFLNECSGNSNPIVSSPIGKYEGSLLKTVLGKTIYSFRGIRYAEAPINELRFKPPVPVKKHEGIYNAKEDAPVCPQPTKDPVAEDCLFLNVYTTKLPDKKEITKRPVIIVLHAGGFYSTTGRSNWAGPQYFMEQNIVLVTHNYRLGALGFLSTGDKEAPGNLGLKDQVEVMKWVKQNIESFGGDPDSVTLFGYSAGAMSVSLHLVSPMSKGLFHKGIIGSSSSLGHFPLGYHQMDVTKRQAQAVGCPDDTSVNILKCLKTKKATELGNSLNRVFEIGYEPVLVWKPVIEKDFGQERFLTDHPIKLILEGKYQKIPILSGITAEEFGHKALEIIKRPQELQRLDEEWETLSPLYFLYERYTERSKNISGSLRKFYFGDKKLDNTTLPQLSQIYNEAQSSFPVNRGVKLLSQNNTESVYYYRFSYKGRYSHCTLSESNGTIPCGAPVHHDDLIYQFYISALFPKFEKNDREFKMVQKMTTMWANFAKTGKPIPEKCGRLDYAEWEPFNLTTQKYMDIDETLKMGEKLYEERYAEWEKLFPLSQYEKNENISY